VKYQQPWGISDPSAPYINGDPSIARQGSIPPAAAFEFPQRELVSVITNSNIVPDDGDLQQVSKGTRSQFMNYCEDTGSVDNLSVALDPPLAGYTFGLPLRVKVRNTNTGAVTIDAGAGRVPVRKPNGSELGAGDLPAFALAELVYDGTVFQVINFVGYTAPAGPPQTFLYNIPYCVDSSTQRNLVIANFSPALTTLSAGTIFMVKIANTNTLFTNINVNGLGEIPIFAQGCNLNWPFLPGDIQVGDVLVFTYDGTQFWVYANPTITEDVTLNVSNPAQMKDLFAALGRKRISTSGSLRILMATGIYQGHTDAAQDTPGYNVITTYHADGDRITLEGTMLTGQTPPLTGHFQRSGNSAGARANDSAYNIQMLRARYGTEIRLDASQWANGLEHHGPGRITYKNILVTGPNYTVTGQRGISSKGSGIQCWGVSCWGIGDAGYAADGNGHLDLYLCHACSCGTRGVALASASAFLGGGGSYGNATNGVEAAHGSRIGTHSYDLLQQSLANGFQSSCNGGNGFSAQTGFILCVWATSVANGVLDLYGFNAGTVCSYLSSIGTVSPAYNTVGNLNSIAIYYG
jgi:hypothetical protein